MTYKLALVVFSLIPIALLMSCSTRQTVHQTERPPQTAQPPETPSLPTVPDSTFPPYDRAPDFPGDFESGGFPKPASLDPQVKFWRDVYASWSRSQVAFHDDLYLNVIYEVAQLPDSAGEGLTPYHKEFIRERMNYWRYRLVNLESKMASGVPLNPEDQKLASLIAQSEDGSAAIRGASERLRYQRGTRERFKRGLEISGMYDRRFREIFRRAGLPEDLVYLPHVESSFQANARSSAGALGIWQFTPGAARMFMNGDDSVSARLDPIASAHGAARYLRYAYDKLGSWPLAVTSYNHGIGGMKRAKDRYGHDFSLIVKDYDHPLFGFASRNYYAEFLAAREIASHPERYFPEGVRYKTDADWTLSRLAASDDHVARPHPVVSRNPQPPLRTAKATQSLAAKFSQAKGQKVTLREISRSRQQYSGKVARVPMSPAKSAGRTTASVRTTPGTRPGAGVKNTVRTAPPPAKSVRAVTIRATIAPSTRPQAPQKVAARR